MFDIGRSARGDRLAFTSLLCATHTLERALSYLGILHTQILTLIYALYKCKNTAVCCQIWLSEMVVQVFKQS
jgi:hypothetical protein